MARCLEAWHLTAIAGFTLFSISFSAGTQFCPEVLDGGNGTNNWDECIPENCTEQELCTYNLHSRCVLVTKNYSSVTHFIELRNRSSIIRLRLFAIGQSVSNKVNVDVILVEEEGNDEPEIWTLTNSSTNFTYITQSSSLKIMFVTHEEWTDLLFHYEEVTYEIHTHVKQSDSGILSSQHEKEDFSRPNTVQLYHLSMLPEAWNESSIMITVYSLNMDEATGDYMLIGAGKEVFGGPPAAHITGKITHPKKYYVATDYAYILFFHASNCKPYEFSIQWERTGKRIIEPDEDPTEKPVADAVLQAVPVCFYNSSWIDVFNRTKETMDLFSRFQQKFADVANRYVKEKNMPFVQEIRASSVQFLHISTIILPSQVDEDLQNGALYVMITIVQNYDSRLAVFRHHQLEEILERFDTYDNENSHALFGFKVGNCPLGVSYKTWYYAAALVVVLCSILFFGLWMCSYNTSWKLRYKPDGKSLSKKLKSKLIHKTFAQNEYVSYYDNHGFIAPKITITNDEGRNIPLGTKGKSTHYSNLETDEESEAEIFDKSWVPKKRSNINKSLERKEYHPTNVQDQQMHIFGAPETGEDDKKSQRLLRQNTLEQNLNEKSPALSDQHTSTDL